MTSPTTYLLATSTGAPGKSLAGLSDGSSPAPTMPRPPPSAAWPEPAAAAAATGPELAVDEEDEPVVPSLVLDGDLRLFFL